MKVLIIDGQGGKIGRALTESIKKYDESIHVLAIGTNSMATAAMIKGGADEAATGENPVVVCAPKVDVIMGPIGILVADALLGEVTPRMAVAVGQSDAQKILIPVNGSRRGKPECIGSDLRCSGTFEKGDPLIQIKES